MTNLSDADRLLHHGPSSLYAGRSRRGNNSELVSHSVNYREKKYSTKDSKGDWRHQRRVSEQMRMNEATGLLEVVDLHKLRQNKYLELK